MLNLKDWNVKHLGETIVSLIVLLVLVAIIMTIISPVLTTVLPTVFATHLTVTDTLLLLVLLRLHTTK
jgi:hypothetical protein